ncbi:hypothetical protein [Niallia taxi]|nr:hypothetical protein [Niallia taxi]
MSNKKNPNPIPKKPTSNPWKKIQHSVDKDTARLIPPTKKK